MTIAITKVGKKIKVALDSGTQETVYINYEDITLTYRADNTVIISVKKSNGLVSNGYNVFPIANVTIGGTVITNQTVFDTKVGEVFT